jgi:hypothetical protein
MHYTDVAPSHLPSLMLPCPYCGHRMEITAIAPARYPNGVTSNDLEDICSATIMMAAYRQLNWPNRAVVE